MAEAAGMTYREAGDPGAPPVLFVHGYPESSFMWRTAMPAVAGAGWRALAPDLAGFGDSDPAAEGEGTWERHVEALERFRSELSLDPVVLVTHDWGVMIGLRWACDHPGAARALAISDGGFFADRRWHDFANALRTPGDGERLMEGMSREGLAAVLAQASSGIGDEAIEEYWKAFSSDAGRRGQLELYRSGDFDKLEPYEGCVAALDVPTLVLWGAEDRFSSARMAQRFHQEIAGSEVVVLEEAGHFIWEDEPEATARALVDFLERRVPR